MGNNHVERRLTILGEPARVAGSGNFMASLEDGQHDEPAFEIWSRYLAPDTVAIDIGANIGLTALALSRIAPAGRVFAIEPSAATFADLSANLAANGADNVEAVQALLGIDGAEKVFLSNAVDPTGSTSIDPANTRASGHAYLQREAHTCLSLDRFCAERDIKRLDFIKIDVEGSELEVLQGAVGTLARHRPLVHLEFNAHCLMNFANVNPPQALEEIRSIFPHVWRVGKSSGVLEPIVDVYSFMFEHVHHHGCVDDLFCGYTEPVQKHGSYFHELTRAQGRLRQAEAERTALAADLERLRVEHAAELTRLAAECAAELERMEGARAGLAADAERLRAERQDLAADAERLRAERQDLAAEIEALRTSTSWRITAPMRSLKHWFRNAP
jgi:FkbM family methyltransferase